MDQRFTDFLLNGIPLALRVKRSIFRQKLTDRRNPSARSRKCFFFFEVGSRDAIDLPRIFLTFSILLERRGKGVANVPKGDVFQSLSGIDAENRHGESARGIGAGNRLRIRRRPIRSRKDPEADAMALSDWRNIRFAAIEEFQVDKGPRMSFALYDYDVTSIMTFFIISYCLRISLNFRKFHFLRKKSAFSVNSCTGLSQDYPRISLELSRSKIFFSPFERGKKIPKNWEIPFGGKITTNGEQIQN